jgi:4'-phosphopantetheinyl transferase
MVTALDVDEVHVWHRLTETTAGATSTLDENVLSAEECARRDRFHFPADRRDYALAHDLLRRSLSRYAAIPPSAWRFVDGVQGKPFVCEGGLSFNLSHTRGVVACGIARTIPLGIDVERTDRITDIERLATRFFTASETAALMSGRVDARARFFDLWTLKEAFIKAIGEGLSQPLHSFSFDLDQDDRRIGFAPPPGFDAAEWQFALYVPLPGARLAVAAHARREQGLRWQAHEVHGSGFTRNHPIRTSHTSAI